MDRKNDSCIKTIGYQRPDLKEHRVDEEILRRLEANDPGVEYLSFIDDEYSDEGWILGTGSAIGDSNLLRMLKICWTVPEIHLLDEFCLGLRHNRSIECLILRLDVY